MIIDKYKYVLCLYVYILYCKIFPVALRYCTFILPSVIRIKLVLTFQGGLYSKKYVRDHFPRDYYNNLNSNIYLRIVLKRPQYCRIGDNVYLKTRISVFWHGKHC